MENILAIIYGRENKNTYTLFDSLFFVKCYVRKQIYIYIVKLTLIAVVIISSITVNAIFIEKTWIADCEQKMKILMLPKKKGALVIWPFNLLNETTKNFVGQGIHLGLFNDLELHNIRTNTDGCRRFLISLDDISKIF